MENLVIADVGSVGKGNTVEVARSSRPPSSISEGDRRSPSRRRRRGSKKGHRHGRRSRRTSRAVKSKRARSPAKRSDSSENNYSASPALPKKKKNKQNYEKELSDALREHQMSMAWLSKLETWVPFAPTVPFAGDGAFCPAAFSTGAAASIPAPAASSAGTAAPFPPQPPGAAPKAPKEAVGNPAAALVHEGYLTAVKIRELLGFPAFPAWDSGHSDFEQVYAAVQTHVNSQKTLERQRDKLSQAVIALSGVVNTAVKEQEEMRTVLCSLRQVLSSEEHLRSLVIAKKAVLTNGGVNVATLLPSPAAAGIPVLSKAATTQRQDDGTPASIRAKLSQRQPNENWTCPHCGSANGEHRRRCVNYMCRYAGGPPSAWNARKAKKGYWKYLDTALSFAGTLDWRNKVNWQVHQAEPTKFGEWFSNSEWQTHEDRLMWETEQFAEDLELFSRLMVPKNAGDQIFMAIRELSEKQEATPLRGWIPVPEVVYHLKSTLKGIVVWDVMAAGLACGYPRDLA